MATTLSRGIAERLDDELGKAAARPRTSGDTFGVLGLSWAVRPRELRPLFAEPLNIDNEVRHQPRSAWASRISPMSPAATTRSRTQVSPSSWHAPAALRDAVYTQEIGQETRERTHLLHSLYAAFQHERLFVAYQPQVVDLRTRKPLGSKCLRWRDDKGDFIRLTGSFLSPSNRA